ncbi:DNA helicase [Trypanosoma cruzi cruzi]|nr:DNA helicase [Trypanosoma cruzi cruzi]
MNCYCEIPVKCTAGKDGNLSYVCAMSKCRFFALCPLHADGWRRVVAPPAVASEFIAVRFEAVLHPEKKTPHVAATVSPPEVEAVIAVLEDAQFQPMWYVAKKAYLYPMESYSHLLVALRKLLVRVHIEEIPSFFFRCLEAVQEIQLQHERNIDGNASQPADVDDVVYSQLRPFQKKGVDFIIARGGRGMIADDMGLGKTVQALAVAHHYRNEWPVLIVCPLSLVENWTKELMRFCSIPIGRIAIFQNSKVRVTDVHSAVIVPYSSLKSLDTQSTTFQVVILDESHYIKTVDSKRTVAALKLCRVARRVLLLSGTPTLSRPIELYPQLQTIMHPSWTPSKSLFAARYCNAFVGRFGVDYLGHSHMSELHVLLQQFVIRRTKRELGNELPSKIRQLLYVYITPKEKKALEKSVLALRNSFRDGATLPTLGTAVSTMNMTQGTGGNLTTCTPGGATATRNMTAFDLKIATARAKIAAVQDYVKSTTEQMVESGQKVIIFAHHQCMMEAIREAVESVQPKQPLDYIYITGETPAAQREALTTHFRTSTNCHVAVLSMHSCGVGHNLTCATMVVFAELDWNPSTHLQCEDRVHRMGQSSACVIKYLLAEGTSDSVIWPMLQTKLNVTHAVLEDSQAGGEGWSAGADTRRILRSDVPLTPSSPEKKQVTLESFLSHSGSRPSRPLTQGSDSNAEVLKTSDESSRADTSPDTPFQSPAAVAPAENVLLGIAKLRQQREARKVVHSTPVLGTAGAGSSPVAAVTVTPPPPPIQRQVTLHEVLTNHPANSPTPKNSPQQRTKFHVAVASKSFNERSGAAHTSSCSSETTVCAPIVSHPVKTLFLTRPASATSSSAASSVKPHAGASAADLSVVSTVSKEGSICLAPSPRSEEIRRYNARRTPFILGSTLGKRSRPDDMEDQVL